MIVQHERTLDRSFGYVREVADALAAALEATDFRGWDPYDALMSPVLGAARDGEACFASCAGSATPIHNSSMLLAAAAARVGDGKAVATAARAVAFTIARQRPDGSWPYGEGPGLDWVDGFHTAYILDS